MKAQLWGWVALLLIPAVAQSATVTVGGTLDDGTPVYENVTGIDGLGTNADGSELIWLGVSETTGFNADENDNIVSVLLQNGVGGADTVSVSLVVSGLEETQWDFSVEAGVQLETVYVFGFGNQTLLNLDPGVNVVVGANGCGFALPYPGGGCNTTELLGISDPVYNPFDYNRLDALTLDEVTNFNGSHFANSFTVVITDATVIPLPGAALLFLSALGLGISRKLVT